MAEIPRSSEQQKLDSELDNLIKLTHVLVNVPALDGGTIPSWKTLEEVKKSGLPTAIEKSQQNKSETL